MQQKIQKIFSYFGSIKNQPFYTSCISQIIEIYEGNPESLKFILFNLNQLIFFNCKELRLRLKHRLITASIVSKLNRIYVQRVKDFIQDNLNFELESFQFDTQAATKVQITNTKWDDLDLFRLIQNQRLLYSTRGKDGNPTASELQQQKQVFDSFLDMNHATMLNIENSFKDVAFGNEATDEAIKNQALKYKQKAEKINQKAKEKLDSVQLTISNPFNLMYEVCINNLLNTEWQLRHLAVLILRELLNNSQFLGFSQTFKLSAKQNRESRFQLISNITKDALKAHLDNVERRKELIDDIIYKNLCLLSLDRFADYQTDESVILIRMVSAQILSVCFRCLQSQRQMHLIKMVRRIFDRQTPFHKDNRKFTWQIKHSFLYFLTVLLKDDKSYSKMVCLNNQECFIKMLANDQVDQIILCICKIIENFIDQPFFSGEKVDKTNRQIWAIVQNLDDISISARDTLSLLIKLFPSFKLNEGNCLDRLKKFFMSKIDEVRAELYKLIGGLYARKKPIEDSKIVERNLVQLLQAAIVQYQPLNFNRVGEVMPEIMPYILKAKNVRKLVQFINTCVTPHQYTQEIINNKFIMPIQKDKSEYNSNEYIYIAQHESVHNPVSSYIDKRIYKMAMTLKECFKNSPQGLQELIKGIEKNNEKNHRGKILVFVIMSELMPKYKKLKLFEEYYEQATKIILLQFNEIADNEIIKIYLPQLERQFKAILENKEYQSEENCKQALSAIREISQGLKKSQAATLKNGVQIAKKISIYYSQPANSALAGDLEMILRIFNNIMRIQRQLLKNIKILAVQYALNYNQAAEVQHLNQIIKAIMEAIREDSYNFISESTANAAASLSMALIKSKKAVYNKFNTNLCYNISTSYQITQLKLNEHQNSVKLEGSFMRGICRYIELMGNINKQYLKEGWKNYLQQAADKSKVQQDKWGEYNRILTLLSGTITSLLKIDQIKIDQDGYFVHKFTKKITQIMRAKIQGDVFTSTMIKIKKILADSMKFLSVNYTNTSNIFFQWLLSEMELENIMVFQVLEKVSADCIVQMAPIASLFILQIIKSITNVSLHDVAMNSLANLIVGVYTNVSRTNFNEKLQKISNQGIQFIKNFKNTSNFKYPLYIKYKTQINLRSYQLEGITWLGFLTKYNLSGALCDDMGLGKTLQTLTVIENEYIKAGQSNQKISYFHSLIICPNTLMQHWAFEYKKYFQNPVCEVFVVDKKSLGEVAKKYDSKKPILFITGYSIIERNDAVFQKLNLKFLILDEGHLIKNVKTLKYKAISKLNGLHRFILTGTPIQNRLIELWGLFDFLMPGYLYTEEIFKKHYEKLFEVNLTTFKEDQLLFSEDQRKTLEKLHFKVMPFIMRRLKTEVLKQLPQKIINDYYCALSQCQTKHYNDLQQRIRIQTDTSTLNPLKNLREMIDIVNHPYLGNLVSKVNWEDSGKFVALGELFQLLGFTGEELAQNKVIIFAKEKATIDLVQRFLKEAHPTIKYLKLTSDVKESQRFTVAQTFNGDSDIKALLVTKAIGGVGLNLTSANCVIMFDSDYNPTVDIQAIDRAHRIGQKRVLNVYRLITQGTLEQKIMGIQKFKTNLANSIVNIDNASIKNVQQSKLPDLLQNARDLKKQMKQPDDNVGKSMYGALVSEMQKNAIETDEFMKRY